MPEPCGSESFANLQRAIERIWRVSDFHRRHWLKRGVKADWIPAVPDELEQLPLIEKEDLLSAQQTEPPWGGNLGVPPSQVAQIHLTSGTSGIGQETYAMTARDVDVMGRSWKRQYDAIGLKPGDVAVYTIPVSFLCAGLSALEGARLHGLVPIVTGLASKAMILEFLTSYQASYLYGTESFLLQLASEVRDAGRAGAWQGQLKGLQAVGSSPQLVEAAAEVYGAPLFEVYGCTQAAAKIATTCRLGVEGGAVHFHDEHLYIELRHPETGDLVESGPAMVIISTTYREASPIIRFNLRDQVEVIPAGSCPCGDPRPGYRPGSVTRTDSMLKIRGMNIWPATIERLLLAHPQVRDFRGQVKRRADGADELIIRVAAASSSATTVALTTELVETIRAATLVRPVVEITPSLGDTTGQYKVQRFTDERSG